MSLLSTSKPNQTFLCISVGRRGHFPMQLVHITTKVISSNTAHGQAYLIQQYVRKVVNDMRKIGDFLRVLRCPPPKKKKEKKSDRHDITELLLTVTLNTIILTFVIYLFTHCAEIIELTGLVFSLY